MPRKTMIEAIRDAISAFGTGGVIAIDSPMTPERVYWAVQQARSTRETAVISTLPPRTARRAAACRNRRTICHLR